MEVTWNIRLPCEKRLYYPKLDPKLLESLDETISTVKPESNSQKINEKIH